MSGGQGLQQELADRATRGDNAADGIDRELSELGFQYAFRNVEDAEQDVSTTVEPEQASQPTAADKVQSTREEIAEVTARIRASWSK